MDLPALTAKLIASGRAEAPDPDAKDRTLRAVLRRLMAALRLRRHA